MKKLLLTALVILSLALLAGCANTEAYEQFLDLDFIVELLNEAPTPDELAGLNLSLANRSERINEERRAMNDRIRERASTTTSRTTGTIWNGANASQIDMTTTETRHVPDSELNLLDLLEITTTLETDAMPRALRDQLHNVIFSFATVDGMEEERLYEVILDGIPSFMGVEFSQFSMADDFADVVKVLVDIYGLDAELLYDENDFSRGVAVFYENVALNFWVRSSMPRIIITLSH